jgi:hypothetical protein
VTHISLSGMGPPEVPAIGLKPGRRGRYWCFGSAAFKVRASLAKVRSDA